MPHALHSRILILCNFVFNFFELTTNSRQLFQSIVLDGGSAARYIYFIYPQKK